MKVTVISAKTCCVCGAPAGTVTNYGVGNGDRWYCPDHVPGGGLVTRGELDRAVKAEREACAKLADPKGGIRHLLPMSPKERERLSLINDVSRHIATKIRARGE